MPGITNDQLIRFGRACMRNALRLRLRCCGRHRWYEAAGGRYYVCPICFNAKKLSPESLISGAELQGTVPLWAWIGDEAAATFSY